MSLDQNVLLASGLLVVGGAAGAEVSCLVGSAIVSFNKHKAKKRKYMEAIQQGTNPEDLVKPSYLDFFKEEVKYIHKIIFNGKQSLTRYDSSQNI